VYRALGGDESGLGRVHLQSALLAAAEGDVTRARTLYVDALVRARASGDAALLNGALSMGLLAIGWGDYQGAQRVLQEWLTLARARHDLVGIAGSAGIVGYATVFTPHRSNTRCASGPSCPVGARTATSELR
jgi:hypothetical protein